MGKEKTVEKNAKNNKDTKPVEESTDEEKAFNNATRRAGLRLDVMGRRKWLQDFYETQKMLVEYVTDKEKKTTESKVPRVSGGQYAITAVEQVLTSELMTRAYKRAQKTTEGLYSVNHEVLLQTIQLTPELNAVFGSQLSGYNKKTGYVGLMRVKEFNHEVDGKKEKTDEFRNFTEKWACDNKHIELTDDGMNFLMYLLHVNRTALSEGSFWMVKYAGKKTVDARAVEMAARTYYLNAGELCLAICKKLGEVSTVWEEASKHEPKDDDDDKQTKKVQKNESKNEKNEKNSSKNEKNSSSKNDKKSGSGKGGKSSKNQKNDSDNDEGNNSD
jgi:hypothetical protein